MVIKDKQCRNCPNTFKPYRSTDRFCSPKCAMEYGYEKAKSKPKRFKAQPQQRINSKADARSRDGFRCRLAHSGLLLPEHQHDKHKIRLEVHHIIFLSEGVYDEDWNLITLCEQCHKQIAHKYKKTYQWRLLKIVNGDDWSPIYEKHPELKQKIGYLLQTAAENMLR